jgi:hypothetical protein
LFPGKGYARIQRDTDGFRVIFVMLNWAHGVACWSVVALAMTLASPFPSTIGNTAPPNPMAVAQADGHAVLTVEIAGRERAHANRCMKERALSHPHGHNLADHSHETPVHAFFSSKPLLTIASSLNTALSISLDLGLSFGIDRPPRV